MCTMDISGSSNGSEGHNRRCGEELRKYEIPVNEAVPYCVRNCNGCVAFTAIVYTLLNIMKARIGYRAPMSTRCIGNNMRFQRDLLQHSLSWASSLQVLPLH
jgi:hypothetical protein